MHNRKQKFLTAIGLFFVLPGCNAPANQGQPQNIQLNTAPKSSFIIDIGFQELPGPIDDVTATAFYMVENEGCAKPLPFSGALLRPDYHLPLTVNSISDGKYEAVFHKDALVDADYFNRGICHWAIQSIAVRFNSPTTTFIASLSIENADPTIEQRYYFLHSDYFKKPAVSDLVFGERPDFYRPELGRQFQIILSARKAPQRKPV